MPVSESAEYESDSGADALDDRPDDDIDRHSKPFDEEDCQPLDLRFSPTPPPPRPQPQPASFAALEADSYSLEQDARVASLAHGLLQRAVADLRSGLQARENMPQLEERALRVLTTSLAAFDCHPDIRSAVPAARYAPFRQTLMIQIDAHYWDTRSKLWADWFIAVFLSPTTAS